jgi:hypothetical protein
MEDGDDTSPPGDARLTLASSPVMVYGSTQNLAAIPFTVLISNRGEGNGVGHRTNWPSHAPL